MNNAARFAIILLTAASCKQPTNDAARKPAEPAATAPAPAADPKLLDACHIKMTAPDAHEWTTFWDPAHARTASRNPSAVRSFYWANPQEQKSANDSHVAIPFELNCSSDQAAKPSIGIDIVTYDSKTTDVPLGPGTYPIAAKARPAKNKPGEFIVGILMYGDSMFTAKTGTLKLERFDAQGGKGSFTITGNEILTGSRPIHIEGTFDMPCRKEMLQSACMSDKAEQPK
jgi:hypothetical protein